MNYHVISFPGLGIEGIKINRLVVSAGNITIAWYGLLITVGIILAVLYLIYRGRQMGIDSDTILDFTIVTVVLAIIGARLYYVLTTLDSGDYHSFVDVIAIWEGGLAIYGALIGGAIGVYIMCRIKKISFLAFADCVVPGILIGQLLGRWGNFANAEAFGTLSRYDFFGYSVDTTGTFSKLFCRMGIQSPLSDGTLSSVMYVHPTFLYESVWNLIGFLWINAIWKKRKSNGQILYLYMMWYGVGRMVIEGLRTDSLYIGQLRISQLVAAVCVVAGACLYLYAQKHPVVPKYITVQKKADNHKTETEDEVNGTAD